MPLLAVRSPQAPYQSPAQTKVSDDASLELNCLEDVYSYYMFAMPIEEHINPGAFNLSWNKCLSAFLVMFAFGMQATLMIAMWNVVVVGDAVWQNSITDIQDHNSRELGLAEGQSCNKGASLCTRAGDIYSCAPPTVQMTGNWDELDVDGDGLWTMDEVNDYRDDLKCKYKVDPVEVFNVYVNFLKSRDNIIWIHPNISDFKAIPKPYFNYAMGDILMCQYRNADMCPNLLKRGFFDTPLKEDNVPRIGNTIESSLEYCNQLLRTGGTCETFLPSTYAVWKKSSHDQCLTPDYSKFTYEHPESGRIKSMLVVDYAARQDFSRASDGILFRMFKVVMITLFLLAEFVELKCVIFITWWVLTFPSDRQVEQAVEEDEDAEGTKSYTIHGITTRHRCFVALITLLRFAMMMFTLITGMTFQLAQTDYMNLLMDGLGLIFIIDIVKIIHEQMLDPELKARCENTAPMAVTVPSGLRWWGDHPAARQLAWFVALVIILAVWYAFHYAKVVIPMHHSLKCACLSRGSQCYEAKTYNKGFWNNYWSEVPTILDTLDKIKVAAKAPKEKSAPNMKLLLSRRKTSRRGRRMWSQDDSDTALNQDASDTTPSEQDTTEQGSDGETFVDSD